MSSKKDCISVSHIGNKEYLIEANTDEARLVSETGEHDLSLVDIKNGPKITIGKDFFGQGYVDRISILRSIPSQPLLIKIRLAG